MIMAKHNAYFVKQRSDDRKLPVFIMNVGVVVYGVQFLLMTTSMELYHTHP